MPRASWVAALCCLFAARDARAEPPCSEDSALSQAAAELLLADAAPDDEALAQAVRRAGSDAVFVRALFVRGHSEARSERFVAEAREHADAPLACGVAHSDTARLTLVAPRAGGLNPIDREPAPLVSGYLDPSFSSPELVVVDGEGGLSHIATSARELRAGIELDTGLTHPLRVQLIAKGPNGPRPVAERLLGTANALTRAMPIDLEPAQQLAVARGDAGAPGLRPHVLLAEVASEHARQVCAAERIAHELEPGEDPEHRLRARGVGARRVGETIARARSEASALQRMLESPAHRLTLLEPSFTDVGLGTARDARGRVCLVVLLASWPRFVGR